MVRRACFVILLLLSRTSVWRLLPRLMLQLRTAARTAKGPKTSRNLRRTAGVTAGLVMERWRPVRSGLTGKDVHCQPFVAIWGLTPLFAQDWCVPWFACDEGWGISMYRWRRDPREGDSGSHKCTGRCWLPPSAPPDATGRADPPVSVTSSLQSAE